MRTRVGQGFAVEQDHAAEGLRAVAHGFRAFHHIDAPGRVGIELRRVIHAPLLALLPHAVVHDEQARAVHAVENGFGNGGTGLHHAHAFDLFEGRSERVAQIFLHLGRRNALGGGVDRMDDAPGLHHGLVEAIGQGGEFDAQGAVAAHFGGGDAPIGVAHGTHREAVAVQGVFAEHEQTGLVGAPDFAAAAHHGTRNGETAVAVGDEQARCAHGLGFGGAGGGGNHHGCAQQQPREKDFGHGNERENDG